VPEEQGFQVLRVAEAEIGANLSMGLQSLLHDAFPAIRTEVTSSSRPISVTSRWRATEQSRPDGVELRVIRVGNTVLRTFGLVDVCVRGGDRSRGLGSTLLAKVTEFAQACEMAFVVLFADDRLYTRNGWAHVTNRCTWVKIDDHVTLGWPSR